MAQTVVVTEFNYTAQDGTPQDWTADTSINVGTGDNRYIAVVVCYKNASTPQPATLSIGTDALTQVATGTNASGFKCALFHGELTVTGSQTLSGTSTGTTGLEGGGYQTVTLVVQGDGALTYGNTTAFGSGAAGSGSSTITRTPNSAVDDVGWMLIMAFDALSASAGTGTTESAYSANEYWIGRRTATGATVALNADRTGAYDALFVGFTLTEASASSIAPQASYYRMMQGA